MSPRAYLRQSKLVQWQCGTPSDLDVHRLKARLAESGLHWPPPEHITYPARRQTSAPWFVKAAPAISC